jgi:ATP-dependent Clp protease ATP-binding subunit ClpC
VQLLVPVLVAIDKRDNCELLLPGISTRSFKGPSLARLLDDVALHLMETIPQEKPERMTAYAFCPHLELRKPRIEIELPTGVKKETFVWKGRMSAVLQRWAEDDFFVVTVPRISTESFAIASPKLLESGLVRWLEARAKQYGHLALDDWVCRTQEYLEVLSVDTDLPTILPSHPIPLAARRGKKKRKKKDAALSEAEKAEKAEKKAKKRVLVPPVVLRTVGQSLTHRAIDGRLGRAFLREKIVDDVAAQLSRDGASLLLVGPSGVGKTAIVHEVVRRMTDTKSTIQDRTEVWQVDGNRIISGMSFVGAWENRVAQMVQELALRQDVLYVSDLPALVYTGRSAHGDTNVADFLVPHLARGDIRIIGECTPERLLATREESPGFFARFRIIDVPELSEEETLIVLAQAVRELSRDDFLAVHPEALETVLALTRRFEANAVHPGKAAALLHRVVADHADVERDDLFRRIIDRKRVIDHFGRHAGLPKFILWEKESRPEHEIREYFSQRIVAQPRAVDAAVDVVALLEQGMNDPARPIGTFLFIGPTGVGKTETAKALAEFLFGAADRLLRFDMSEFMSMESVVRLIGDRFHPDGELTRRVQQQPFCVVLLDEIEKAHPSIFDALLQVLGEGRLTNAAGRTVDFSSTVIVMTSNLGVRDAGKSLGFGAVTRASLDAHFGAAAERYFRPEFFNRIDRVVPFSALGRDAIVPLVKRLLESMLGRRGLRQNRVVVDVDPCLVDLFIDQGFDPKYGARSIKRILEQRLAVPLAQHLVTHRSSELTIAELFPRNDLLGMKLTWPKAAGTAPLRGIEPVKDWTDVFARSERISMLLERFEHDPKRAAVERAHSRLVGGFNQGTLSEADQDRLAMLAAILDEHTSLRAATEAFVDRHLVLETFEESIGTDEGEVWGKEWTRTKTLTWPVVRPVRPIRGPLKTNVKEALVDLELRFAALIYRTDSAGQPSERPVLLRFLPVSGGVVAQIRAASLAHAFLECWGGSGGWASGRAFLRSENDGWVEVDRAQLIRETGDTGPAAVELAGAGVRGLVEGELGYFMVGDSGARVVSLIRVEDVGGGVDPIARLVETDAEIEARRIARRSAAESIDLLPPLSVVRVIDDLDRSELARALYDVAMRRIFSAFGAEASA